MTCPNMGTYSICPSSQNSLFYIEFLANVNVYNV